MSTRKAVEAVLFQRRLLSLVTVFNLLSILIWIISISEPHWLEVDGRTGLYVPKHRRYFLHSNSGIWRFCRNSYPDNYRPSTQSYKCAYYDLFNKEHNKVLLDYQRTVAAFSIISLLIMVMGFAFSIYTFFQTRYMYKRLTAACHLVAAGCALIVIEVSTTLIHYSADNMPYRHPPGSTWNYGFSFILAWITFIIELSAAIAFAICSRKRKKGKAPDDQFAIEEEPTIIGR